jgi:uncharacterized membrane protein
MWFLMALIAPILWALVSIIDNYSVHGIYEDEYDGMVVSGVFQSLPWLLVPLGVIGFTFPAIEVATLALFSGGLFILAFFCYFRALFVSNDSALMQILWNLSVPVVPFFAWLVIGEVLTAMHYAGIGIAFFGTLLFNFDGTVKRIGFRRIMLPMLGAVGFLSLSMVVAKKAYQLPDADFWSIFLLFSLGATVTSLVALALGKKNPFEKAKKIATLSGKYFFFFLVAEGLSLGGTITSQKAISLAPAVSFVAVIESLVPVFVMMFSLFLIQMMKVSGHAAVGDVYKGQLSGAGIKILALAFVVIGIYIVA